MNSKQNFMEDLWNEVEYAPSVLVYIGCRLTKLIKHDREGDYRDGSDGSRSERPEKIYE